MSEFAATGDRCEKCGNKVAGAEFCPDGNCPHSEDAINARAAATKRPFQGLSRNTLEALYMGALEMITELETKVVNEITNEPGTSWQLTDGNLHIRVAS